MDETLYEGFVSDLKLAISNPDMASVRENVLKVVREYTEAPQPDSSYRTIEVGVPRGIAFASGVYVPERQLLTLYTYDGEPCDYRMEFRSRKTPDRSAKNHHRADRLTTGLIFW